MVRDGSGNSTMPVSRWTLETPPRSLEYSSSQGQECADHAAAAAGAGGSFLMFQPLIR